ncbi:MAG TPA: 50S ribosomal protein L28 [Candidatus Saccharimonadales bacterium]|nr:50S ribosomal protein L28 [Candidatus Saccharimonadales bacterium]
MQKCDLTGKGKQFGSNVSFSQRHTNKVFKPNLQMKTVVVDGKRVQMKLSTQAIRTLKKKGLLGNNAPEKVVVTVAPAQSAE